MFQGEFLPSYSKIDAKKRRGEKRASQHKNDGREGDDFSEQADQAKKQHGNMRGYKSAVV